jgi:hypothetical protein
LDIEHDMLLSESVLNLTFLALRLSLDTSMESPCTRDGVACSIRHFQHRICVPRRAYKLFETIGILLAGARTRDIHLGSVELGAGEFERSAIPTNDLDYRLLFITIRPFRIGSTSRTQPLAPAALLVVHRRNPHIHLP